jgi:hypothetical protein
MLVLTVRARWSTEKLYPKLSMHSSINASALEASPSDFAAFIKDLHSMVRRFGWGGATIEKHFEPTSMKCGINVGLQYDYILPIEWIGSWYPALVSMLGLQDVVKSGWREVNAGYGGAVPEVRDIPYFATIPHCNPIQAPHCCLP